MHKKEIKVGEVFKYELVKLKCVSSQVAYPCAFCDLYDSYEDKCLGRNLVGECGKEAREDNTDVFFVKVED